MLRRSTRFLFLCLAFIFGIALHSFVAPAKQILEPFWWYVMFLGGAVGYVLRKPRRLVILGSALAALGFFRYSQTIPNLSEDHLLHYAGKTVTIQGIVAALPRAREKSTAYVLETTSLHSGRDDLKIKGKLLLTVDPLPAYNYGDVLRFTCTPAPLSKYEQYARRDNILASCAFPDYLARTDTHQGSAITAGLFRVREVFNQRLLNLFPNPYGGLLSGILYGDTSGISRSLKEAFRTTGLSHLTALSGYNITIISSVLIGSLIGIGLTRTQALPATIVLILAFVISTGAEASVVRASVMGFLAMLAKRVGRLSYPKGALALAGALMLAVNPRLLRFDLGFLLSFLATIALITFAEFFKERALLRRLPKFFGIREAAASSCAVLVFTTPVLIYATGMLGPFSLLSNILVVPVVPLAMATGFFAVLIGFISETLGRWLSFFARLILGYMITIAEWLAGLGAIHLKVSFFSAALLLFASVFSIWRWKQKVHAS